MFIYEIVADDPLTLLGQQPIAGGSRGIAVLGDVAYVSGGSGINVVDISDPENPFIVGTVGVGTHVGARIEGNALVVTRPIGNDFILDVYSIAADPLNPTLLGSRVC